MSQREVIQALFFSQLLFLIVALIISFFLFSSFSNWLDLFYWDAHDIIVFGGLSSVAIVLVNIVLYKVFPPSYLDDGGINQKIFTNQSVWNILWLTLLIAISEEALFRGVLQTTFGYIPASIIFAVVHIRYLTKPVLLIAVVAMSFYLGYTYELTNNLFVPMMIHFLIDFLLGLYIRNKT